MNSLSDTARPAAGASYVDAALLQTVAGMRPGWIVLRDVALAGGGQEPQARARDALLRPEIGVALLDIPPGSTTRCAQERLRRSLDVVDFQGRFGAYPPVVYICMYICMPSRTLPDLEWVLTREFGSLPPFVPPGGGAWVG